MIIYQLHDVGYKRSFPTFGATSHGLQAVLVAGVPAVDSSQGRRQLSSVLWGAEHAQPEAQGELFPPLAQGREAQLSECRCVAWIVRPQDDSQHTLLYALKLVVLLLCKARVPHGCGVFQGRSNEPLIECGYCLR